MAPADQGDQSELDGVLFTDNDTADLMLKRCDQITGLNHRNTLPLQIQMKYRITKYKVYRIRCVQASHRLDLKAEEP